jgi:hypothetical protein
VEDEIPSPIERRRDPKQENEREMEMILSLSQPFFNHVKISHSLGEDNLRGRSVEESDGVKSNLQGTIRWKDRRKEGEGKTGFVPKRNILHQNLEIIEE